VFKKIRWAYLIVLVVAVVALAGLSIVMIRSATTPPRQIALFDSGVPGTPEAAQALEYAKHAGFDEVINYNAINATPEAIDAYLRYAQHLDIKVIVSLKDLLGPADLDPATVATLDAYPAVWGYYIADEPAEGQASLEWLPRLNRQVKLGSSKPTIASYWRYPAKYLRSVKPGSDHLMMDYYPFPDGPQQTYGKVSDISAVAHDVQQAAGQDSWFALQGFSYYVSEPDMIASFHFPEQPPPDSNRGAPTTPVMVAMAKAALTGGVRNLAVFSYEYAADIPGQLEQIRHAVHQIRHSSEFTG
jgi:hypothetical protein